MIDKIKQYSAQLIMAALFAAGWVSHGMYNTKITEAIALARQEAAQSAAQEIAKITVSNTTIQNKVVERIRTETVYQDCKHSSDTFNLITEAFTK